MLPLLFKQLVRLSFLAVGVALVKDAVVIINQGQAAIVERLGVYRGQLQPGLHLMLPFIDKVRTRVTVREQVLDIPPQSCITSDNAPLRADAVVYWRIQDPEKAVYAVDTLVTAIQNLVLTQLRAEVGKLSLDDTFSLRSRINEVLLQELDEATQSWGVKITRVEVRDIIPNPEILSAMEMQMAAERTRRAQVIKSEGEKQAILNNAAADAQARIIQAESTKTSNIVIAEGEKERQSREAEGFAAAYNELRAVTGDKDLAMKLQLTKAYVDALAKSASSESSKVLMLPTNLEHGIQSSAVLADLQANAFAKVLNPAKDGKGETQEPAAQAAPGAKEPLS